VLLFGSFAPDFTTAASTICWVLLALLLPVNLVDRHTHAMLFLRAWILMAVILSLAFLSGLVPNAFPSEEILAAHLSVSVLLTLMYQGYAGPSGWRWLFAALPVLLTGVLFAGSGTGMLALAAGMTAWGLVRNPFRAFLAAMVMLIAAGMVLGLMPARRAVPLAADGAAIGDILTPLLFCGLLLGSAILLRNGGMPRRAIRTGRPALAGAAYVVTVFGVTHGFDGYLNGLLLLAGFAAAFRRLEAPAAQTAAAASGAVAPSRLRFGLASLLFGTLLFSSSCASVSHGNTSRVTGDMSLIETGTHWPNPAEFDTLKKLGYQFAVVTLDENPEHWRRTFDAAERAGIRLVVGLYPYPYKWEHDQWTITPEGLEFLRFAAARKTLVKAIYVFNEPYLTDPATGRQADCGALTPPQLRMLRNEIRSHYSGARIYHDLGQPSAWAPGAYFARQRPCVGDKYARTTGVADFAGVWDYPMTGGLYQRERMISAVQREIDYVSKEMLAQPVVLAQAFRCKGCDGATRMPATGEIKDMNCSFRALAPHGLSWYAWRQDAYDEVLSVRGDLWPMTGANACAAAGQ
jgi:hypothetical protein